MTAPIEFQPHPERFYTMAAIEQHLAGVMALKTFLAIHELECTGRDRLCQNGLWGYEIILAMKRKADALPVARGAAKERDGEGQPPQGAVAPKRKRGRPPKAAMATGRVTAAEIGLDREARK